MPELLEYNSTPPPFRLWPFLRLAIFAWAFDVLAVLSFPLQRWIMPMTVRPAARAQLQIALDEWWPYLAFLAILLALVDAVRWEMTRKEPAPLYARLLRGSLLASAFLVSVFMPFRGYA